MLTEFSIGNYQAFSTPQRVPLRPITLIFGPNSAGKSALLRSLLVARHAILNAKLSKSEGAGERHPGSYADIVRNGNTNPISFGFTVQPEGKSCEEALELGLSWKENYSGGLETVALSLKHKHSNLMTYSAKGNSKYLRIKSLGDDLRQLMTSARLEADAEGGLDELVHNSVKKRLSLQKNVALPGMDEDHFRFEDSNTDEIDLFSALEETHKQGKSNERTLDWMHTIKEAVASLKSAMTTQIKVVDASVRDELTKLIYHGPIRPICDEITKERQSEPGMMEWWSLAEDAKLLAKVNDWLARDIFKTKYRLEFDRLFPDSSLQNLFHNLFMNEIAGSAFEAKLDSDQGYRESVIDRISSNYENEAEDSLKEDSQDDEEPTEGAIQDRARAIAESVLEGSYAKLGLEHYEDLINQGEAEAFLLDGLMNCTKSGLRRMLESVKNGKGLKVAGGFDAAKIRFTVAPGRHAVCPSNMGVGFSQMMPLVASAFGSENQLIAIEQPELHVHPALQTELADLFIQSAKERGNRFLIETHSEHLILRLLRRVRETTEGELEAGRHPLRPSDLCVLYVQPGDQGSEVIELPVTADGDFRVPWPGGFFAERITEIFGPSSKEDKYDSGS